MRAAHVVEAVRGAEAVLMARLPEGGLMARAAAGLAARCAGLLPRVYGSRVVLLVGGGDNGGDALYAGARLARRGARVHALLAGAKAHVGGLATLRAAGGRVISASDPGGDGLADPEIVGAVIGEADLVVDGLLGIGGRGGLRPAYADLAVRANDASGTVVAVDLPSGVDADTGRVDGTAVRADVTVTFGTYKPGLLVDPGAAYAGVVDLVDIGLDPLLPDPDVVAPQAGDVAGVLAAPGPESDKYRRGVLGVVAGGARFAGAAVLAVGGAVRAGAGMVRFAGVERVTAGVRERWPEAVTTVVEYGDADAVLGAGRVQAWLAGPGMGTDDGAARVLAGVLGTELPVLVDADGLTLLAARPELVVDRAYPTLLTPHAGELSRLLDGVGESAGRAAIEGDRLRHARLAAERYGCTVLLKGSTTVIAEPDRITRVNPTGTPWLATAGTGDVLSGIAGALLSAGLSTFDAAVAGAYLHGLAARLAADGSPISAGDLLDTLHAAFRTVA
ncbi:MAG: NAD(P)H-hydrate dehydratase [Streptosporangiales bacterium]|nr:NAD(P)H-hydrate dehydratase [Streptosporangiales bacterium]